MQTLAVLELAMRFPGILLLVMGALACSQAAGPAHDDLTRALTAAASVEDVEAILDAELLPMTEAATERAEAIIQREDLAAAQKHRLLAPALREIGPQLERRAAIVLNALQGRDLGPKGEAIRQMLHLARNLGEAATKAEREPYWDRINGPAAHNQNYLYAPALPDAVADRFWLMTHWIEILGGMYDDADYAWVYADSGRASFLAEEAGASGFEHVPDWHLVPLEIWNDAGLSCNQKFMAAKYTMWQNPDWGGGEHYVNEWWSWEAGYKEEDDALFTGNMLAALAAMYETTRDARTLHRLRALFEAFKHYDRITRDDPNPIALEDPDGRITRGTKTRNLYPEDEMNIFDIEIVGGQIVFHHNNSWPDHYTGRERKNVSRDQYYGLFTGYRVLWEVLTALDDRTAEEQQLLDDLVAHTQSITDYVFGQSNLHWDWGLDYMFYALFEGSCANPPNFTFLMFFGHVGLEEMTGQSFTKFDALHDLGLALFRFGRSLGKVTLSEAVFEPAQTGLTALNQYLAALYMSDVTPADWLFIWPPEAIDLNDAGRRILWRRVVAAFYRKFGLVGSPPYAAILGELFDEAYSPRPTPEIFYNHNNGEYAWLEASGVGVEDFVLPFALVVSRAANRDELAAQLTARYQALVESGDINFDDTDLPY
jgi:hypothetical protein